MAFTFTSRISDTGPTSSQTKTTASLTPTANSLLVVAGSVSLPGGGITASWTISDTAGLTWTLRANAAMADRGDIRVWTAPVGASPAAMTVTLDPFSGTDVSFISIEIFDVTGHNVSAPMAQAAVATTTVGSGDTVSATVTLGSNPLATSAVVGIFNSNNDGVGAFTTPTGYTDVSNPSGNVWHTGVFWDTGITAPGITCPDMGTTVDTWNVGVALELAGAPVPPTLVAYYPPPSWATTGTTDTVTGITTQAGDLVVVAMATGEDDTVSNITGNGLTYGSLGFATTVGNEMVQAWTAIDNAGGTNWTLTITRSATGSNSGAAVWIFRNASLGAEVGPTLHGNGVQPSQTITTTQDQSAIVFFSGDWSAITVAGATYTSINGAQPVVDQAVQVVSGHSVYALHYANAGLVGSKTATITAPTGQRPTSVAIEVKGAVPAYVAPLGDTIAWTYGVRRQ